MKIVPYLELKFWPVSCKNALTPIVIRVRWRLAGRYKVSEKQRVDQGLLDSRTAAEHVHEASLLDGSADGFLDAFELGDDFFLSKSTFSQQPE